MRHNIASATPETWNQKNQPSDIERFEETPGTVTALAKEAPAVLAALARRNRGLLLISLSFIGTAALLWYLAKED